MLRATSHTYAGAAEEALPLKTTTRRFTPGISRSGVKGTDTRIRDVSIGKVTNLRGHAAPEAARGSDGISGVKPDTGLIKENIMQKGELYDRH